MLTFRPQETHFSSSSNGYPLSFQFNSLLPLREGLVKTILKVFPTFSPTQLMLTELMAVLLSGS